MREFEDHFRTSSFCTTGGCLGVDTTGERVEIAESSDPRATLSVTREQWSAFVAGVKNGEFDLE